MMKSSTTYLACTLRRKITAFCLKKFVSISDLIVKPNSYICFCEFFFSSIFFLTIISHWFSIIIISTDSETVRLPYEVQEFYSFCWFCKMGSMRWLQLPLVLVRKKVMNQCSLDFPVSFAFLSLFYLPCRKGVCCSVLVILFVWVKVFISWWSTIADNIIDTRIILLLEI